MSLTPDMIAAFVDGELDDLTARRIEREAASDSALAAEIERHRALKARLAAHYAPVIEEPVPDRLRALLAGAAVVDTSMADRRAARRVRFAPLHWAVLAASLVLGVSIGMQPWRPAAPIAADQHGVFAAGALAMTLDEQLAARQPSEAAVRVGLSFRDRAGRYCRSFESAVIDGIGCREGERWRLEAMRRGAVRGQFRQAGSGDMAEIASTMMVGDPLDANAERGARDAGWIVR